ncbi:uncharacterized protein [Brachionichthys hirsutus]|uniref:uncharacterized protein n=1 Tax=Brachionichthys hirsutus TaxID=412623 RepID=UPI0036052BAB
MTELAKRTQERLYGKKNENTGADSRREPDSHSPCRKSSSRSRSRSRSRDGRTCQEDRQGSDKTAKHGYQGGEEVKEATTDSRQSPLPRYSDSQAGPSGAARPPYWTYTQEGLLSPVDPSSYPARSTMDKLRHRTLKDVQFQNPDLSACEGQGGSVSRPHCLNDISMKRPGPHGWPPKPRHAKTAAVDSVPRPPRLIQQQKAAVGKRKTGRPNVSSSKGQRGRIRPPPSAQGTKTAQNKCPSMKAATRAQKKRRNRARRRRRRLETPWSAEARTESLRCHDGQGGSASRPRRVPPLSRCVPPLSRCVPPLSRCVPPLSRCVPPLSRCVPAEQKVEEIDGDSMDMQSGSVHQMLTRGQIKLKLFNPNGKRRELGGLPRLEAPNCFRSEGFHGCHLYFHL